MENQILDNLNSEQKEVNYQKRAILWFVLGIFSNILLKIFLKDIDKKLAQLDALGNSIAIFSVVMLILIFVFSILAFGFGLYFSVKNFKNSKSHAVSKFILFFANLLCLLFVIKLFSVGFLIFIENYQ